MNSSITSTETTAQAPRTNGEAIRLLVRKLIETVRAVDAAKAADFESRLGATSDVEMLAFVCTVMKPAGAEAFVASTLAATSVNVPADVLGRVTRIVSAIIEIAS